MIRARGDHIPQGTPLSRGKKQKYQRYGVTGEGRGQANANGHFVGFAATPGTSNHGWAAAVDIDRTKSGFTGGQENNSPEFRWLNKFAGDFNFTFGVKGEHWHLDWVPFTQNVKSIRDTEQKSNFALDINVGKTN